MNQIDDQQARESLEAISRIKRKTREILGYRASSTHFFIWGTIVFLICLIEYLRGYIGLWPFLGLNGLGCIASAVISSRRSTNRNFFGDQSAANNWRFTLTLLVCFLSLFALVSLIQPLGGKDITLLIALIVATIYTVVGIWTGIRFALAGLAYISSVAACYLLLDQTYFLWLGLLSGSVLIGTGFIMRKL